MSKKKIIDCISIRVYTFWSNNYIEYESNGDRNKTLSIKKYLKEIKPYLKNIINNLNGSDKWKVQLTIEIICMIL